MNANSARVDSGWVLGLRDRAYRLRLVLHLDLAHRHPGRAAGGVFMVPRRVSDKYRQLAEQTDDPVIKNELLELASVCEEVASNIKDHLTGG